MQEKDPNDWTKLERIRYLLDHWSDIFDPNVASSLSGQHGSSGSDFGMNEMTRDRAVVQLQVALSLLSLWRPDLFQHLKAYRCDAQWRQVRTKVKFRGPTGNMLEGPGWAKERMVPSWVDMGLVADAESWLERVLPDVFIPKLLWDGLTKAAKVSTIS